MSYLPFTCKYCGGTFCKKHRLPENHECTFELKHVPVVSTTPRESRQKYQKEALKKADSRVYLDKGPRTLKKYLRRQEKQRTKSVRQMRGYSDKIRQYKATDILFFLIISLSILAVIFSFLGIGEYLFLSLNAVATKFTFHTFITSLFIDYFNPLDPFFFFSIIFIFIMLYFTYKLARFLEMGMGKKFIVQLFLISGFFSIVFYILLRLALIAYYPIVNNEFADGVGLLWGGIFGLITFTIFPSMNRETSAYLTLVRVRMTGKSFLFMIIFIRLFFGLIYGLFYSYLYFLLYLPELGGILGSYIVYRYRIFTK